jgi:hypothetical protein
VKVNFIFIFSVLVMSTKFDQRASSTETRIKAEDLVWPFPRGLISGGGHSCLATFIHPSRVRVKQRESDNVCFWSEGAGGSAVRGVSRQSNRKADAGPEGAACRAVPHSLRGAPGERHAVVRTPACREHRLMSVGVGQHHCFFSRCSWHGNLRPLSGPYEGTVPHIIV